MVIRQEAAALTVRGIHPEDFDLVRPNQDLYLCDQTSPTAIYKLSRNYLTNFVGDLVITDAGEALPPAKLFFLHWNAAGSNFNVAVIPFKRPDGSNGELEHITFAPLNLPSLTP